jgi:Ca2+-binding RTX toxin-like protein
MTDLSVNGAEVEKLTFSGSTDLGGIGNGQDNVMHGSEGADTINGAVGNDVIEGGLGVDVMSGGTGNDQFYYQIASNPELATLGGDTINGFEVGKDTINLYDLFADFGIESADPLADGFLKFTVSGSDTKVQFDSDGGGDGFVTLATLTGVTGVTLAEVIYPPAPVVL